MYNRARLLYNKEMKFSIITLFPESLDSYRDSSMIKRATLRKLISIQAVNPRDFCTDSHKKADDKPYGGGPGMVMKAFPLVQAVDSLHLKKDARRKILIMSPRGKQFTQKEAQQYAKKYDDLILIAGHYEGIDARVKKILKAEEVSVGPYTLTGGELPALTIIDAVSRHIPGVLGKTISLEEKRVASGETYTRPEVLTYKGKKYRVPTVLLSGHHKNIDSYRSKKA